MTKLLFIPPLNIYHSTIPPPLRLALKGVIYDALSPQPHQNSDAFIKATFPRHQFCLIQERENRRRGGEADREVEINGNVEH